MDKSHSVVGAKRVVSRGYGALFVGMHYVGSKAHRFLSPLQI